jgi:hypothetical protein
MKLKMDMNFDGKFTITDCWLFLKALFFYPGDYLVSKIIDTSFGVFFEFDKQNLGGFFSGTFSFIFWFIVLSLVYTWWVQLADQNKKGYSETRQFLTPDQKTKRKCETDRKKWEKREAELKIWLEEKKAKREP